MAVISEICEPLKPSWFTPKRLLVIFCLINLVNYIDRGAIASNGVNGDQETCTEAGVCSGGTGIHMNEALLQDIPASNPGEKSLIQQAISQTFQSTAHLANLLPTGTVLTFQLLSPIFSNQGECDPVSRAMTAALIGLWGLSCFVLSFSDSFRDKEGNVAYGFATFKGLWAIDGSDSDQLPPEAASEYRIKALDFVHAILSVLVFAVIALFDGNVVHCFYPEPSVEVKELLSALPVGIGLTCSMLFVLFPTRRHGIGFPVF